MAAEFIDFYEALGLPLEADSKQVRSRMSEVYLEAQRNLDHRNFPTRVKYQELFEVVLPRARYILLNEARRDEYDQLVRAFRGIPPSPSPSPLPPKTPGKTAPSPTALPVAPSFGRGDASGFRLAEEQNAPAGAKAPRVEGLPNSPLDAAQMAQQRDEMLQQWRARLEAAIARDEQEQSARSPASSSDEASHASARSRPARAPVSPIQFDFGDSDAGEHEDGKTRLSPQELERVRTDRKREAIKEILVSVGTKGAIIGGMASAFPLGGLLIYLMGLYYPRDAAPKVALPSTVAWFVSLCLVASASYLAAYYLSREMRHKKALELSLLSLEDILRQLGRSY